MVKEDMALLMLAISKSTYSGIFEFVPKKFKNSKEFILKSLRLNGLWLNFLSDNFKDDKEVVLIAVNNRADALNFVSDRLKIDSDVLQTAKKSLTLKITLDADELPF